MCLSLCVCSYTQAMTVYIEKPKTVVQVGDTVLVKVMIDTNGEEINALEGVIKIPTHVEVKTIQTAGSIFNLWPVFPVHKNKEISFTGGSPSGVFGNKLRVFTFAVVPQKTGMMVFTIPNLIAYKADGKGTPISVYNQGGTSIPVAEKINTTQDELQLLIDNDSEPPEKFKIEYDQDARLYDGKSFLSFYTTDAESGLKGYEVIEGDTHTFLTEGIYILEGELKENIVVTAVDYAGNKRTQKLIIHPYTLSIWNYVLIGGIVILSVVGILWWFRTKRNETV